MSLTCRTYLYLDQQAARFERNAELAAEPADRMRLGRIAAVFEKLTTVVNRIAELGEAWCLTSAKSAQEAGR